MSARALVLLTLLLAPAARGGAEVGAQAVVERVAPGQTDVYQIEFRGQQVAFVALEGDHRSNLDLHVVDGSGHPVASDLGASDRAYLSFIPAQTGTFYVKVQNLGDQPNEYALTTN